MTAIEQFLFGNFAKMPTWVRVVTYLFILLLFSYLLLVPRYVNGELGTQDAAGGWKAYRAGQLRMHSEGRVFKYAVNEEGYWSVPIVSLLPHGVTIEVFHVDADAWFTVNLKWTDLWTSDVHRLVVRNSPPAITIVNYQRSWMGLARGLRPSVAVAGELVYPRPLPLPSGVGPVLPSTSPMNIPVKPPSTYSPSPNSQGDSLQVPSVKLPAPNNYPSRNPDEVRQEIKPVVQKKVFQRVGEISGVPAAKVTPATPLTGRSGLTYTQRIAIVDRLERDFDISIPDEHWNYLNTAGELTDYVEQRLIYRGLEESPTRPVFKR